MRKFCKLITHENRSCFSRIDPTAGNIGNVNVLNKSFIGTFMFTNIVWIDFVTNLQVYNSFYRVLIPKVKNEWISSTH